MDKYSVDKKNDDIEKNAEELVKVGKCKSIDEAREIAVKEKDNEQ